MSDQPQNPNLHHKPTKEELEANIAASQAALDSLPIVSDPIAPTPDPALSDPAPVPTPDPVSLDPAPTDPATLPTPVPTITPVTPPAPVAPAPATPELDKDKMLSDSFKESMILSQSKKKLEDAIDEAYQTPEPTETDLKSAYPLWEEMSDVERQLATESLHQRTISTKIRTIRDAQKADEVKIAARESEIDSYTIKSDVLKQFPKLEGKQEEFKKFATKPTRLTLDLEDLVKLFLLETVPAPVKHTGKMFEQGTGGPSDTPIVPSDKITQAQAEVLRKNDYKKFKEYLKAGKIEQVG